MKPGQGRNAWAKAWPWVASAGFQVGALFQIAHILRTGTAEGVSTIQWILCSAILAGWALYYREFLDPAGRRAAVFVSWLSCVVYAVIAVLTFVY